MTARSDALRHCMKCGKSLEDKKDPHEDRMRRVCSDSSCGWIFYDNPVPVVAAIVEHSETRDSNESAEIVLVRSHGWPENFFGLVTGFLEKGEATEEGVVREVKEELGLSDVQLQSLIGVYEFKRQNQIIIAYHVRAFGPIKMDTVELAAYKRVPISKLRPWAAGTGKAVADFLLLRAKQLQSKL